MTEAQFRMWGDIAVQCDMPSLADATTTARAVAAFPHMFEALRREREKAAALEAKVNSVPWQLIRTTAKGALEFSYVPATSIVRLLRWLDDNEPQQEAQP